MSTAKKFRMENGEAVTVNQEFDDETTRKRKIPSKKPSTIPNQDNSDVAPKTNDEDVLKEALMADFEDRMVHLQTGKIFLKCLKFCF